MKSTSHGSQPLTPGMSVALGFFSMRSLFGLAGLAALAALAMSTLI